MARKKTRSAAPAPGAPATAPAAPPRLVTGSQSYIKVRRICAVLVGLVFFVASVLKLIDPVGAGLVVGEYLNFFHMGFLSGIAKPLAVGMALLEGFVGCALVTGSYRKFFAVAGLALVVFFTLLTFVLWRSGRSFDCGCFGEAIHLTTLQTFLKNVVLLVLGLVAFLPLRNFGEEKKHKKVAMYIVCASLVGLCVFSLATIPMVDFTEFNDSSRLLATRSHEIPFENDQVTTYIYEKNGQEGVFTLDNLPDSTWTFVRTSTLLKEDNIFETDYPSLPLSDRDGNVADTLAAVGRVLVVSVYEPSGMDARGWARVASAVRSASEHCFTPVIAASVPVGEDVPLPGGVSELDRATILATAYSSDHKTLMTLNRSNGGMTYFNNGNLIQKWSLRNLPGEEELASLQARDATDAMLSASTTGRLRFQAFLLFTLAAMVLI